MNWIKSYYHQNELILDFTANNVAKMSPMDAGIHAVNYIVENYPSPYTLMLSGGIDSQAMLWAWHKSRKEFKIVSARYNQDMNSHDLKTLEKFALLHRIPITFLDFDVLDFLEKDYDNWANTYNCSSPQICTYMKIASLVESGTRIFSGNYISHTGIDSLDYTILGLKRYAEITNTPVVPFFFLSTPELAYSFMNISYKQISSLDYSENYKNRVHCYQEGGYPVIAQDIKYTGFEKIKDYYDQHYNHLITIKHKLMVSSNPSRRVFDLLLRHPYERKFKPPKLKFITNTYDKSLK